MKKVLLKVLIVTLIISAILGISVIILNKWDDTTEKVLFTTTCIFGFSVFGLCCSTIYDKEKLKKFSVTGIGICLVSCLLSLLMIWEVLNIYAFEEIISKILISLIILSASFGHLSLLMLVNSRLKNVEYMKIITIFLAIVLDILLIIEILFEIEISWQLLSVIAILISLGTLATPIINCIIKNSDLNNKGNEYTRLEQLKKLLDSEAINEEEYKKEKEKILNNK